MRAGVAVSVVGHIGFVLLTMLAWEARTTLTPTIGSIVPIEIVDVAAESNVRALAEDLPDEEVAPSEETPSEEEPEPAPSPEPAPPARQRQNNDSFDLAAVSGLIDKQREPGRERNEGERADRNQRGAGLGTEQRVAMQDRVISLTRRHLQRCWRMPLDQPDPERLVVVLEFDLDRNGNLRGPPRVISPTNYTFDQPMRVAVENAQRAVTTCDPYPFATDPVVGEHYETWARLRFRFIPVTN